MATMITNTLSLITPASYPMLSTINSTRLYKNIKKKQNQYGLNNVTFYCIICTYPLQLIKTPIVRDSLQANLFNLAASVAPVILPTIATTIIKMTHPQDAPSFKRPI